MLGRGGRSLSLDIPSRKAKTLEQWRPEVVLSEA